MQIAGEPLGRVIDRFGVKVGPRTMSGFPASGYGWAIYGCTPRTKHRPARLALRKIGSPLRIGEPTSFQRAILDLSRPEAREGADRPPPRFRTIQVRPKDLATNLRQAEDAVNRPNGPVGALIGIGEEVPHARHKTA